MAVKRKKRFTVTLDGSDYKRLQELATRSNPALSLQYVVNYAIRQLLDEAEDSRQVMDLGNPVGNRR